MGGLSSKRSATYQWKSPSFFFLQARLSDPVWEATTYLCLKSTYFCPQDKSARRINKQVPSYCTYSCRYSVSSERPVGPKSKGEFHQQCLSPALNPFSAIVSRAKRIAHLLIGNKLWVYNEFAGRAFRHLFASLYCRPQCRKE